MAVLPIAAPADLPPAIPASAAAKTMLGSPESKGRVRASSIGSTHLVGAGGRGPEGQLWQYCHSFDEAQRGTESMAVLP